MTFKILVTDVISSDGGNGSAISQVVIDFERLVDAQAAYDKLKDSTYQLDAPGHNMTMGRTVTKLF